MMGRSKSKKSSPSLPPELIIEILSRLPLEHLSRVQLVSKEWQALTRDHYLINKHMARTPVLHHWHNEIHAPTNDDKKVTYCYMHGCDGVVIILNLTSDKYLLWNPAIFRALDLPHPHDRTIGLAMVYVPATRDYRIVSFYYKGKQYASGVGCQVLTPGPNMSWKNLPFPDLPNQGRVFMIATGGDVHCAVTTKDESDDDDDDEGGVEMIVTLNVAAEYFVINRVGNMFGDDVALNWDGRIGLVKLVGKSLEVVKLEDYKEHKWGAGKKVIPLPFVGKPGFVGSIHPLFNRGGDIWFWLQGKKIFTYTIGTGKIVHVKKSKALSYKSQRIIYSYKESLLCFKGMRSDEDIKLYSFRPKNRPST